MQKKITFNRKILTVNYQLLTVIMDDYHQQNATSKSQEIFGSAFLEGPECRPTNC